MITEYINEKIEKVKTSFVNEFPNQGYTIFINLWNDGDFKIEVRSAIKSDIHHFTYHDSKGDFVLHEFDKDSLIEIEDENGDIYWVDADKFE